MSKCINERKVKTTHHTTTYDDCNKIWRGVQSEPTYGPESSIGQVVLAQLLSDPEHIAQICHHNGKHYTNREIANLSQRVARYFKTLPVEQCDIIGLCAANSDFVAPLFFGAMLCGLTVSTLDPSFDKAGIKHIYSITKPLLMFCDGGVYETVKAAFEDIELKATIFTMKDHLAGVPTIAEFLLATASEEEFYMEPLKLGYAQTAAIVCSSGTTGLPKGVCISHASLLNANHFNFKPEDRIFSYSTLYWVSGLSSLLIGTMSGMTRIIHDRSYTPEEFFDIVEKHKVTILATPPSQMAMSVSSPKIRTADLSSITFYFCSGSAISYAVVERIRRYMPNALFTTNYGLSETVVVVCAGAITPDGATGQLTRNNEFKVLDEHAQHLGPGEVGELCIRTKYPWAGYYGNPEATAEIYKDGWLHSGDLGYIDRQGSVFIVDRKKDILKYNNFHYFPTEIELVIQQMPGVAEVCVCGLADVVATTLPTAAIVKSPGCELTEQDVCRYVAERMTHFKRLHGGVYFMSELPKTASGKYLRREVTRICEGLRKAT